MGLLGLEGFTVNLHGQSRGGKSVTSKLCASVWAGHESRDGFVYGVNNTINSLDEILGTYNTLPFIMEDANNMDKKRKVDIISHYENREWGWKSTYGKRFKAETGTDLVSGRNHDF